MFIDDVKNADYWVPFCADELRDGRERWTPFICRMKEHLQVAPVFEVTNVADYFYCGTGQEGWDIFTDFPRPMPPFRHTWFEWKLPKISLSGKTIRPLDHAAIFERVGCLYMCEEVPIKFRSKLTPGTQYKVNVFAFGKAIDVRRPVILPATVFGLNESFEPVSTAADQGGQVNYFFPGANQAKAAECRDDFIAMGKNACALMYVPLLAISMLNCKNVTTRTITIPSALAKKHARKGHQVTTSHSIIEIQPITAVISRETAQSGYSRQGAPIIRGHFKDYTSGKGLFGKLQGRFWWSQHLSGKQQPQYRLAAASGDLDKRWLPESAALPDQHGPAVEGRTNPKGSS